MIYTYHCKVCDTDQDERRSVTERFDAPECRKCGLETELKVVGAWIAPVTRAGTGSSGLAKRAKAQVRSQQLQ